MTMSDSRETIAKPSVGAAVLPYRTPPVLVGRRADVRCALLVFEAFTVQTSARRRRSSIDAAPPMAASDAGSGTSSVVRMLSR